MQNKLRVWWIPQVGSDVPTFYVNVDSIEEGVKMTDTLARYDMYQYNYNIKPDYSNSGGLQMFEDGEWVDWEIVDENLGYFNDPEEYLEALKVLGKGLK